MPDPNTSDRERLLRLIDGGADVLKEVQQQREEPAAEKKPVTVVPTAAGAAKPAPADIAFSLKRWWLKSGLKTSSIIKLFLALTLLAVAVYSFTNVVRSMGKADKTASSAAPAVSQERDLGENGIGLRLVGVDWGDDPVALLEDLKTGRTYFAKKNDKIKDARIKQIAKDKVTVFFRGKNMELR